jgi:hypothetical protein
MSDKQVTAGVRDNGKFVKGVSGNPNGRPKGISITAMVKDKLKEKPEGQDEKTYADLIISAILKKALKDNDTNMLKTVWQYIDGMPKQTIAGDPENPLESNINVTFKDGRSKPTD